MPNWCANRLRVTGLAGDIEKVQALMTGAGVPGYVRADQTLDADISLSWGFLNECAATVLARRIDNE